MIIFPTSIEQIGPGVGLSDLPEGLSVQMADPTDDLDFARNAVTLTFDLSVFESVRLAFEARESNDEPHAPPPGPFPDGTDFDGVAVSADGVDWYEIQGLRELKGTEFTAFDIDLDAAVAAAGLAFNSTFRIRFCQYDNMPTLMDGISIRGIRLTGELDRAVVWVDAEYAGEEWGTESRPFDSFAEAIEAVDTGGTIKIKGGVATLDEPIRITKPVRIVAVP